MKIDREELNTLLNNINGNMKIYDENIDVIMKISDDLEMKRLKHETVQFREDISEYGYDFLQSSNEELVSRLNTLIGPSTVISQDTDKNNCLKLIKKTTSKK